MSCGCFQQLRPAALSLTSPTEFRYIDGQFGSIHQAPAFKKPQNQAFEGGSGRHGAKLVGRLDLGHVILHPEELLELSGFLT